LWTLCPARTRWTLWTRRGLAASRHSERHDEDRLLISRIGKPSGINEKRLVDFKPLFPETYRHHY
jgi:hypothetical protein